VVSTDRTYPGQRFGLPETGVGSVASMGRRVTAFVIDVALCTVLALAFTWPALPGNLSLYIWAAMTTLAVGVFGFTPGHFALGIRVAPVTGAAFVGAWAVLRTILVFLLVPPLLTDADGRGLQDRLCRTVVIRMR
jgi:hypothetical protein